MKKHVSAILAISLVSIGFAATAIADALGEQEQQNSKHIRCTPYPECVLLEGQTLNPMLEELLEEEKQSDTP